ncbi:MAG: hypothetical protein HRU36_02640 [Rickettsiales bacterium]|nr:hypothetical protein [Rickettsiales bacterium]
MMKRELGVSERKEDVRDDYSDSSIDSERPSSGSYDVSGDVTPRTFRQESTAMIERMREMGYGTSGFPSIPPHTGLVGSSMESSLVGIDSDVHSHVRHYTHGIDMFPHSSGLYQGKMGKPFLGMKHAPVQSNSFILNSFYKLKKTSQTQVKEIAQSVTVSAKTIKTGLDVFTWYKSPTSSNANSVAESLITTYASYKGFDYFSISSSSMLFIYTAWKEGIESAVQQGINSVAYMIAPTAINIILPGYGAVIYKVIISSFAVYGVGEKIYSLYQDNYGDSAKSYEIESNEARLAWFKTCADFTEIEWCKRKVQEYTDIVTLLKYQIDDSELAGEMPISKLEV